MGEELKWDRRRKAVIWLMAKLQEMIDRDQVVPSPGMMTVSGKGMSAHDQITADGFVPTSDEVLLAASGIRAFLNRERGGGRGEKGQGR